MAKEKIIIEPKQKNKRQGLSIVAFDKYQSLDLSYAQELFVNDIASLVQWDPAKTFEWEGCALKLRAHLIKSRTVILLDVEPSGIENQAALLHLLIELNQKGSRLVAFGSGISLLAQTGLLNDKTVALDRIYLDEYETRFPQVNFSVNIPFSCDNNLYCSATSVESTKYDISGVGKEREMHTINDFNLSNIVHTHMDFLSNENYTSCNTRLNETLSWAERHLEKIRNLDQLADRSFMSRRNFDRQFRIVYKQSPKEWLTEKRINLAVNYLKSSDMGIEEIAYAAGFSSSVNFRNNFKSYIGASPSEYRSHVSLTA